MDAFTFSDREMLQKIHIFKAKATSYLSFETICQPLTKARERENPTVFLKEDSGSDIQEFRKAENEKYGEGRKSLALRGPTLMRQRI